MQLAWVGEEQWGRGHRRILSGLKTTTASSKLRAGQRPLQKPLVQAPTRAACQTGLLLDLPLVVRTRLKGIPSPNAIAPEIDAQFSLLSWERLKYEPLNPHNRSGSTRSRSYRTCAHTLRTQVRSRVLDSFPVCHRQVFSVRSRAPGTRSIHTSRRDLFAQARWHRQALRTAQHLKRSTDRAYGETSRQRRAEHVATLHFSVGILALLPAPLGANLAGIMANLTRPRRRSADEA